MSKREHVVQLLRRRIECAEYTFSSLPTAERLARETGVSYVTARRALQAVVDSGELRRGETGRLQLAERERPSLNVAYVHPLPVMADHVWRRAVLAECQAADAGLREIVYCHADDPALFDALDEKFDLILLDTHRRDRLLMDKVKRLGRRVVMMYQDWSDEGILSVDGPELREIETLIAYLRALGHQRIDAVNTEPAGRVVEDRLRVWRQALERHGGDGECHDHPVPPFTAGGPHAREMVRRLVDDGALRATALFCLSVDCAFGVLRGLHDRGLAVPRDLSVAAFGHGELAELSVPSLTVVDLTDIQEAIHELFRHFRGEAPAPEGGVFRPRRAEALRLGESTGPAPGARNHL